MNPILLRSHYILAAKQNRFKRPWIPKRSRPLRDLEMCDPRTLEDVGRPRRSRFWREKTSRQSGESFPDVITCGRMEVMKWFLG